MSSHHTENEVRYNPQCTCPQCSAQTFIVFARGAYSNDEFVRRAQKYRLNEAQQKIVDEMKLKLWNDSARGDIA